jgi:hypothetical protein
MDLRAYYQKIREIENKIIDRFPVVVGIDPHNAGKPGVCTEVSRSLAAKMLAEGSAREATPEETKTFRKAQADAIRTALEADAAKLVQFKVVSVDEVRKLTKDRV